MSIKGKRVLITGCSGLLGPALCDVLLNEGAIVIGLDRYHHPLSRIHEIAHRIELITGDVCDYERFLQLLSEHQIEFIYHLAAQALVQEALDNPVATFKDNIEGTWNVLEATRTQMQSSTKLKGVLLASSDKAYGEQTELPYQESFAMQGRFPYDVSKSCADLIAQSYAASYGLPVCVTRCGNLFGGGDLHFSRIVPGTILSLLNGERPVIRSDGTPLRDYVYVKDVALAYLAISETMMRDPSIAGECFNISNDRPVSVVEIVELIQSLTGGAEQKPIIKNLASKEIKRQYLSSDKIRRLLNWSPKYTLQEGLKETITWYSAKFKENAQLMSLV